MRSIKQQRAAAIAVAIVIGFGMFTFFKGRLAEGTASADTIQMLDSATADSLAQDSIALAAAKADSIAAADSAAAAAAVADSIAAAAARPAGGYRAGEDPEYALKMGWPVEGPAALPGAILPNRRIIAYYGNPLSTRMGVLGEFEKAEMFRRFDRQLAEWRAADPATPVQPAFHLVAVVAAADPGPSGDYRTIMRDTLVEQVYGWAKEKNAILFVDLQVGHSDIREILPRFEQFLIRPDVHLGLDPEFMMKTGHKPGAKIGTMDAADINYATNYLAELVRKYNLPPKVVIIHRFTRGMLTNSDKITLRPETQVVIHMDGWGAPWLKRDSYKDYVVSEPVQYTGFKLFYHNDTKKGDPLMTPADLLRLHPRPLYLQYQ